MPLSGTMKPYPLETSNHLMTPVTSMTAAPVSLTRSPSVSGTDSKVLTGPLGRISSDAMTTKAFSSPAPWEGASTNLCHQDNTTWQMKKNKMQSCNLVATPPCEHHGKNESLFAKQRALTRISGR